MSLRGRLGALAVVFAVVLAAFLVTLVRSRTPGCAIAAPRPALPAVLRSLGDFDQAYDPGNPPAVEEAAARAAAALHPDLIGSAGTAPVAVASARRGAPAALVVPLRAPQTTSPAGEHLNGLVVFLLDCQGNAYFASVEDDAAAQPPLAMFPALSRAQAVAILGTAAPLRLEYATSPLRPRWADTASPSRSVPAR